LAGYKLGGVMVNYELMQKIRKLDYKLEEDEVKELIADYLVMYSVIFKISEACVNESKHNKEPFATLEEIREYLNELL
jgi:hypothetical protein